MIDFLHKVTFSDIGNAASILGLLLTVLVFIGLRSIKRSYIFTARVPELLKKLVAHASSIAAYQKDFSNSQQEIQLELAGTEIVLKSLRRKVSRSTRGSVRRVLKVVKDSNGPNQSHDNVWTIYVEMQKLIIEVQELQSDLKWGR